MAGEYSSQAYEARTSKITIEPRRGTIYDRNGVVLATSVEATTIYVDPVEVSDANLTASLLAEVLGGETKDYLEQVTANNTRYSVIKRKADTAVGDQLEQLAEEKVAEAQTEENAKASAEERDAKTINDGIHYVTEWRREYPNGQTAGQIVGVCSVGLDEDNNREYYYGICGLEYYYDDILAGETGYDETEYGRDGTAIPGATHEHKDAVDGEDVVISIDIELQQYVEERLTQGVKDTGGESGSAVVMDGATGEIYAAASLPLFNPNDRNSIKDGATQLKCVTDLFEPGSIFKSVATMAILETDTMTPDDTLYCPSILYADEYKISDHEDRSDTTYSLREILNESSNVGISLATEKMGFTTFYDYILKYNLHKKTGVDFPGEGEDGTDVLGYLTNVDDWTLAQSYNICFGQGISVTPMQMVRFYGAITNNGVECTPHFLMSKVGSGETVEYGTADVIENKESIPTMQSMLKTVVSDGTGTAAAIDGYNVAGKTSTAEVYDEVNGGYKEGVYNMAFTGFLADSSSQLVCFVGSYNVPNYGSIVTPIFKDIMTTAIDRFNITSNG